MIVLDANLLLYAYDSTSARHEAAREWLKGAFTGPEWVGLPWQSVWAFLRLSTNSRILQNCLPMETAIATVQQWIGVRQVRLLVPGERHWMLLQQMLIQGNVRGSRTTDAELAALTVEHGGILYTADLGFARYPGLRFVNPLAES